MSLSALRRTIRRCTAALLVVLGAIAIEVASLEYPDGGNLVGGGAILAGAAYLLISGFVGFVAPDDEPGASAGVDDRDGGVDDKDGGVDGKDGGAGRSTTSPSSTE